MTPQYQPDKTRAEILEAAFNVVWEKGFHATSISDILKETKLTKGALYHHFKSKKELGLLLIREVLAGHIATQWQQPLQATTDPLLTLIDILHGMAEECQDEIIEKGCPINNLSQELSGDAEYREALQQVYKAWHDAISDALEKGKTQGTVKKDTASSELAWCFISILEGASGLMKNMRNTHVGISCVRYMEQYLTARRP